MKRLPRNVRDVDNCRSDQTGEVAGVLLTGRGPGGKGWDDDREGIREWWVYHLRNPGPTTFKERPFGMRQASRAQAQKNQRKKLKKSRTRKT